MRIGFLTERMILGYGVDLVTDRLAEGLSAMGHDVTVYCSFHDDTFLDGKYELKALQVAHSNYAPRYESRAEEAVRQFVKDEDLWIVESFPFFKAASRFDRPWIAIDYGVVPSQTFALFARRHFDYIRKKQYGEYFQRASAIICISSFLRQNLPQALRQRSLVIHLGVDHYSRDYLVDLRTELGLGGVVILYQGRSTDTTPYKGVDNLLEVYSRLRKEKNDVRLLISTLCSLEEQTRLENAGATVLNGVLMPFVPSVYRCADLFVTATQWEGFDLPLLEASYFGLPVVAFAIGAHPEIVEQGRTGYLVKDKAEFLDRVRMLVGDADLRRQMGKNGANFAVKFNWSGAVRELERVVTDTIEGGIRVPHTLV